MGGETLRMATWTGRLFHAPPPDRWPAARTVAAGPDVATLGDHSLSDTCRDARVLCPSRACRIAANDHRGMPSGIAVATTSTRRPRKLRASATLAIRWTVFSKFQLPHKSSVLLLDAPSGPLTAG